MPAHTGWQHKVLSAAAVEAWQARGGKLGVWPSSLSAVVLDVDHGNPIPLLEAVVELPEFITAYRTRRGAHLWLGRDRAVSSPKWQGYGCAGTGTSISTKTPSPACRTGPPSQRDFPAAAQGGVGDHQATQAPAYDPDLDGPLSCHRVCVYKQNPHLYYMRGD